jgi:CheY-like chemotaxis protein
VTWADRMRRRWRWRDLPVRDKGFIVIAFPLVPLLITSALFYASHVRANRADEWVAHTLQVKTELADALTLLVDTELGARGYLMTRSPDTLAAYRSANAALPGVLRRLVLLTADNPQQGERLRTIKDDPALKTIPVVMVTSSREEGDLMARYELGVNAYVVKPVAFQDFMVAVRQLGGFWPLVSEAPPAAAR